MCIKFSAQLVSDLKAELGKLLVTSQGVVGIDIGFRYRGGVRKDDEVCLRVFLEGKKVPDRALGAKSVAKALGRHPKEVDVIDLTAFNFPREGAPPQLKAQPDAFAATRLNPIQPGISVSHFGQGAGTLGLIAYRGQERYLLSCAHVIAGQFARRSDPVFQPAVLDGGNPDFDAIGYLEDWFVDEEGDAAIALLNRARMHQHGQFTTEQELSGAGVVKLGDKVEKSGRGSAITQALVDGIGLYQMNITGFGQVWISGFRLVPRNSSRSVEVSRAGDSGAVWYRSNGVTEGVGLHIDGEPPQAHPRRTEYAIACHLKTVLDRFQLKVTPESGADKAPSKPAPAPDPDPVLALADWMQLHGPKINEMMVAIVNGAIPNPLHLPEDGLQKPIPREN